MNDCNGCRDKCYGCTDEFEIEQWMEENQELMKSLAEQERDDSKENS